MTLPELINALENANGPSRDVDIAIFKYLKPEYADYVEGRGGLVHKCDGEDQRVRSDIRWSSYTSSLDSALWLFSQTLPGWRIENLCEWEHERLRSRGAWTCDVVGAGDIFTRQSGKCANATNPAAALVLATLKALQARGDV
jgi:hypothetical protein